MTRIPTLLGLATLLFTFGCGRTSSYETPGSIDSSPELDAAVPPEGGDADDGSCAKYAAMIARDAKGPYCTATVRLSTVDASILGWSLDCGPYETTTEADARAAFAPWAGPYSPADSYRYISGPAPTDEHVFFHDPGDFGGLAAVSVATGHVLFVGEIDWSAMGSIRYPTTFRPASELPTSCKKTVPPRVRGIDERGMTLDPSLYEAALDVVARTPIVSGLDTTLGLVNVLVVKFPVDGSIGSGGPPKNEWLFFLNAALLE